MAYFIYLFLVFQISATEPSLYSGKLQKIQDFGTYNLEDLKGSPSLWYFYQPGCESCRRQSTEFSCLPPEMKILAIGVLGSYEATKKELRFHQKKAVAVYGGAEWQKRFDVQQTPTLLLINKQGNVFFRQNSKMNCSQIKEILNKNL